RAHANVRLHQWSHVAELVAEEDLHRSADGRSLAPDSVAVLVEHLRELGELLRCRGHAVPGVGVRRRDPQGALASGAADPDRWVRSLHGLRLVDGLGQLVVRTVERGAVVSPQRTDDLQGFLETIESPT